MKYVKYVQHGHWNVKITNKDGRVYLLSYFGFKTKREAQTQADQANRIMGFSAEVIKQ